VVLNTSLNGPGEPICADASDCLTFFMGHGIDCLVVDDVVVSKP
jgi:carbamoyltransferase